MLHTPALFSGISDWSGKLKKDFEFATEYMITDRTNLRAFSSGRSCDQFEGHVLRFQFQFIFWQDPTAWQAWKCRKLD